MKQATRLKKSLTIKQERERLRRRVHRFYLRFNASDWHGCLELVDPQLQEKVDSASYSRQMKSFKDTYSTVNLWLIRLSLHLVPTLHQRDRRPFAFVYVIWQDDAHGFHLFRERWVKVDGKWFSRVVGLVPNARSAGSGSLHASD